MFSERIDSPPRLTLVTASDGAWARPEVRSPGAPAPSQLPRPYWRSAPRRSGLRRSSVRVTFREAFRHRPGRREAYRRGGDPAASQIRTAEIEAQPGVEATPRGPILRRAADFLAQVFRPAGF